MLWWEEDWGSALRLLSRVGEVLRNSSIQNQLPTECHVSPNKPVLLLRHWLGAACGNIVFPGTPGNSASETPCGWRSARPILLAALYSLHSESPTFSMPFLVTLAHKDGQSRLTEKMNPLNYLAVANAGLY